LCERARVLGGAAIVENAPGGGVRVFAALPLD
jgi:signal transduction histidine kinase